MIAYSIDQNWVPYLLLIARMSGKSSNYVLEIGKEGEAVNRFLVASP